MTRYNATGTSPAMVEFRYLARTANNWMASKTTPTTKLSSLRTLCALKRRTHRNQLKTSVVAARDSRHLRAPRAPGSPNHLPVPNAVGALPRAIRHQPLRASLRAFLENLMSEAGISSHHERSLRLDPSPDKVNRPTWSEVPRAAYLLCGTFSKRKQDIPALQAAQIVATGK